MFDSHNKHGGSKPAVTPVGGKSAPSLASYEHQPVKWDKWMCIAKHTYALKEDKQKSWNRLFPLFIKVQKDSD